MEIKITSQKENPLLKRKEIQFDVDHSTGSTPPRLEVRRAVATALKSNVELVFIKKFETKTGTHTAAGAANLYESIEQAKLIEPEYIVKRNVPPEKPKEEAKEQK
ncbi:MAG: 30S ribosomal protein S24e [Candidatus Bathyarchaeia archaeon]|jgi:small subunit ribosomal protein S24e